MILTRHPDAVLSSYRAHIDRPTMLDVGYAHQMRILQEAGDRAVVVTAEALFEDPMVTLQALCKALDVPWDPVMLRWDKGGRPEDGVWAKYWYHSVHNSRGWQPRKLSHHPAPVELRELREACMEHYRDLASKAIQSLNMAKFNQPDPRNAGTWCWVNGLVKREDAKVSVLDSVVQGGDAVWEGLRVANGRVYQLDEHLQRLRDSAHVLCFKDIPSTQSIKEAVFQTLEANNMTDGVHVRLTLTRGEKSTSGMDPRLNVHGPTLIVLPEYKGAVRIW